MPSQMGIQVFGKIRPDRDIYEDIRSENQLIPGAPRNTQHNWFFPPFIYKAGTDIGHFLKNFHMMTQVLAGIRSKT
jgi:hypothetical protein